MESSFYKTYFQLEKDNWWFKARRNLIFWILKKYGNGKKVLDYGCGSGFLVGQLQERGFDASGVDVSKEAIDFGSEKGINNLSKIDGVLTNYPDASFDLVLAMDVIEHIKEDDLVIKELERLVKPNGILVITVPAYKWMWGVQDEVAHHFRRYTMGSILKLASVTRLSIVKKSYFNTFLFPVAAIVRLASKWFNKKNRESDFEINNNFLNPLLYFIFNTEIKLLKWLNYPFGVSILLVARKRSDQKA